MKPAHYLWVGSDLISQHRTWTEAVAAAKPYLDGSKSTGHYDGGTVRVETVLGIEGERLANRPDSDGAGP